MKTIHPLSLFRFNLFFAIVMLLAGNLGLQAETRRNQDRMNILFCIADDWSWPHAGIAGDPIARTPTVDRLAREGLYFDHAYCAVPSCTPSRASILTGLYPHQLGPGASLRGNLTTEFEVFPDTLEKAGYLVGFTGKGWGPGNVEASGRKRNPAGSAFVKHALEFDKNMEDFLAELKPGQPFCFWFGSKDPHRIYEPGSGVKAGYKPADVRVPTYWPDSEEVRSDICDYYAEVERFDRDIGSLVEVLKRRDLLENTLIVISSDNGMPFPRCKANLYDSGSRMPLVVWNPSRVKNLGKVPAFTVLTDLAPTFLEAAAIPPPPSMTGRSLWPIFKGEQISERNSAFLQRERHANVRANSLAYPARAIRTADYLYIWNFRPDRWPAGDPTGLESYTYQMSTPASTPPFGDSDNGPTKAFILQNRGKIGNRFFELCFGKRPTEELYITSKDPDQVVNVANSPEYEAVKKELRAQLEEWMKKTADPRLASDDNRWDEYPYIMDSPKNVK
jgi:N-sulfoglucosamine sulfohydrolase